MTNLRNAILATLAYYDIFEYPLTLVELYRHLINPARLEHLSAGVDNISLADLSHELDFLHKSGRIGLSNGHYMLSSDRIELFESRMAREKVAARKWKRLVRIGRWFQAVPYLRGLFVSGSLALNNSTQRADFDILTVSRSGRLYTCRVLLSLAASLFFARRTKHERVAPDKFCFNHYVTDRRLALEYQSIYTAQTYAALVPIFLQNDIGRQFYNQNGWINKYVFHFKPEREFVMKKLPVSQMLRRIAAAGEWVLDSRLGEWLEHTLKKYQQRRIGSNPVTHEPGGRIVFTEDHLEFHPYSFESALISRYNEHLKQLGIYPPSSEKDSGLVPHLVAQR